MKIELQRGDITKMDVDAIVNAANTSLLASAYQNSMQLAAENGLRSLSASMQKIIPAMRTLYLPRHA